MPLGQIRGAGGYFSLKQKQEIIRKVMDTVVSVECKGLRPVTWSTIEDVESGAWGVAGQPITDDDLRQMASQNK